MATKRTALLAALGKRPPRDLDFLDTKTAPQLPDTRGLFLRGFSQSKFTPSRRDRLRKFLVL